MNAHELETYRGFTIHIAVHEMPKQWVCEITFERAEQQACKCSPPMFRHQACRLKRSMLTFSMEMQFKARMLVDEWIGKQPD
ncbi:hypothetical protein Bphyt_6344 [Paraburkholderia phytofirmans PsJN]|uniref:Uncharacterized protein n=1 Tax=Paraburkholderia phytofirmans (strain DSM 17436 / LMG 22146 / PsJN) TaxID=398527 RepID=B2T8K7_PARPJ|nr:hypothetical protein Bphyt_6344 [Paraburkholderia phytofirmans PsJN]